MMTTETASVSPSYPAWMDVRRPEKQSRLLNFPLFIGSLIRAVLLIPHLIVLYFLGIVAALLYLIASVAILFSGRYPQGLYNFVAGVMRWSQRVNGYLNCLYDKYAPFSFEQDESYPLTFGVEYPQTSSRLLNFPILGLIIKSVLLIPHIVVIYFLYLVAAVLLFIAQFGVLFAGAFPAGMHRFITGVLRWNLRLNCYLYGLSDRYPPFSMN